MNATGIIGPIFVSDTINAERKAEQILAKFFENLSDQDKEYGF